MKLINLTQKQTITSQLVVAETWLDATIGLLNKPKGTAMLFHTSWGIHTFGMKYPIDVLILDGKMKVIKIKRYLKPNQLFFWNPIFSNIVELPDNKTFKVTIGDTLKICV